MTDFRLNLIYQSNCQANLPLHLIYHCTPPLHFGRYSSQVNSLSCTILNYYLISKLFHIEWCFILVVYSHLHYAIKIVLQYKIRVKDLGSFRLTVRNLHFHRFCNFAGFILETVKQSLSHSCRTEFTRQGISLPKDSYS